MNFGCAKLIPSTSSIHWIDQLEKIVGKTHVIRPGADDFAKYEQDETEDLRFPPQAVVRPASADEIQKIVRLAQTEKLPIVPRGGGTGLSGGALAVKGGIVLSLERMNRILEIDKYNFFAIVQPGIITQQFQETVEAEGLFYPPDPASRGSCTIGGNVAENAGGPRALKYGVTKDYVYGLKAVLANGECVSFGGKLLKDVAGYNMTQLFVGSEGTLGIVTEITLKLIALPRLRRTLLAPFDDLHQAAAAVPAIMARGIMPCALEFMERDCLQAIENHIGKPVRFSKNAAVLLIEVNGNHESMLDAEIETIGEVLEEYDAVDCFIAESTAQQNEIWDIRRIAGEAVKSISLYKEEDTVVPRSRVPELVSGVHEICDRWGLRVICYGHAGDGNIHCNILKAGMTDKKWNEELPLAVEEIFKHTVSLGGSISGEHGIGYIQKRYLPLSLGEAEIELHRQLKHALDPQNLLNPDKILPN
ncbi:FAD-binding protein [candidate division KSB1 bacterium]|nr:MAG: FAD-binding protein [candidate division KSB1 bacterium]